MFYKDNSQQKLDIGGGVQTPGNYVTVNNYNGEEIVVQPTSKYYHSGVYAAFSFTSAGGVQFNTNINSNL